MKYTMKYELQQNSQIMMKMWK